MNRGLASRRGAKSRISNLRPGWDTKADVCPSADCPCRAERFVVLSLNRLLYIPLEKICLLRLPSRSLGGFKGGEIRVGRAMEAEAAW